MRWCVFMMALAACEEHGFRPIYEAPDAAPRQLYLDVTVGRNGVTVFTNASDQDNGCSARQFPHPGQSAFWEDAGCGAPSCLDRSTAFTVHIANLDEPLQPAGPSTWSIAFDVTQYPEATLSIVGCGGEALVPIGGLEAPHPTVTADRLDATRQLSAAWTSDVPAFSSIVVFWTWGFGQAAHVESTSYTYTLGQYEQPEDFHVVSVWTFAEFRTERTPFGIVNIWPGDQVSTNLPMIAP